MSLRLARSMLSAIALTALVAGASALPGSGPAQANAGACKAQCQAAYARCYNQSGGDRRKCDQQLNLCLKSCLRNNAIN
ncbi:MAG: hypothetical protein GC150_02660 [Rhizobiales bacterium]|nr:hypothetical protein [Hyphomicrobiales bacterium]